MKGQLYTVSAPSGAGKTSLVKQLVTRLDGLQISVSHTTRPMRPGEVDGRDYFFVDHAEFERLIGADQFLEYAKVFDNYYGTTLGAVEQTLQKNQDVLLEIDWQGAAQVKQKQHDSCSIFILPPSKQALLDRLNSRGQDSVEVIKRRTNEAVAEMRHYASADYLVINDQFEVAVAELSAIVMSQRLGLVRQQLKHQILVDKLLDI